MAAVAPMPAAIVHKLIVNNTMPFTFVLRVAGGCIARSHDGDDAWRSATSSKQQADLLPGCVRKYPAD